MKVAEVFEVEPEEKDRPSDIAAITAYVLKHYAFLPKPIAVNLEGDDNLPDPGLIAAEIVEELQAVLSQFAEIANDLKRS